MSEAKIEGSTVMYVEKSVYDSIKAKHEKVLEMLRIAESALQKIAGPKKKDGTYFYSISQIQKMEMYDCGADNETARVALDEIERLKK